MPPKSNAKPRKPPHRNRLTNVELRHLGYPYKGPDGWLSWGHVKLIVAMGWHHPKGHRDHLTELWGVGEIKFANLGKELMTTQCLGGWLRRQTTPGEKMLCPIQKAFPNVAPGDWSSSLDGLSFEDAVKREVARLEEAQREALEKMKLAVVEGKKLAVVSKSEPSDSPVLETLVQVDAAKTAAAR